MSLRTSLATSVASAVLALGACGSPKDTTSGCVPGQSVACAGDNGCSGHQICKSDGSGFDVCVCGGSTDAGTDGAPHPFAESGPDSGKLGAACKNSGQCREGLSCFTTDSSAVRGEGPSNGLCVADCALDPSVCTKFDPGSTCRTLDDGGTPNDVSDDTAYCFAGCTLGDPPPSADKCRGRADLACNQLAAGADRGYCRPACQNDSGCAPRHCDLGTGFCGDTPFATTGIGTACDPATPACECLPHGGGYAECSGVCTLGAVACGEDRKMGPPYDNYCLLEPGGLLGTGDLGYCAKLCDCNDDCGRTDAVCQPNTTAKESAGRAGMCASKTFASGGARPGIPCP